MARPVRIVCVGGGYVAVYLARALRRAVRRGEVRLTVVSRENFQTFHGLVPEMLACKIGSEHLLSSARRLFPPADFHNAEVVRIDSGRQQVVTSRFLDGREQVLDYDHLVLGMGVRDDLSRYPGIAEHSLKLKTYWDCFKTRNHVLSMLELAEIEEDPEERRRLLSFVIAGGNYAGIEVSAAIEDLVRNMARSDYPGLPADEIKVTVVHPGEQVLPELGDRFPRLARYVERYFARSPGLEVRHGRRIRAATAEAAILDDDSEIATRTIISCTGAAVSPLLDQLEIQRDERGRVKTDAYCRVRGYDNIWAGGDCAAVPHPRGGHCPQLAIFAMMAGRRIGKNLLRDARGKSLKPYSFNELGDACALGRHRAVAQLKGVGFSGVPAWLTWRLFMLIYLPTWNRRARVALDWLILPLVGRDSVNVRVESELGLEPVLYEPGQVIVRQGEVGQKLFLIRGGEVEVLREEAGGERLLATLGPGDHFGEAAVFQNVRRTATVRAVSRVQLIALGAGAASTLSEGLADLGQRIQAAPRPVDEAG